MLILLPSNNSSVKISSFPVQNIKAHGNKSNENNSKQLYQLKLNKKKEKIV